MFDFQHIRDSLGASTSRAAAEWWLRTGLIAVEAADWPTAFDRLERLEDVGKEAFSPAAWRELVAALLTICVEGALASRVDTVVGRIAPQGWPNGELVGASALLAEIGHAAGSPVVSQKALNAFVRHFPHAHQGYYARAIMLEAGQEPVKAAADYQAVARLASHEALAEHARFRAAAALLLAGRQRGRARVMMKSVDRTRLNPSERLWYVSAMASSPNWLDRRRALDTLEDILDLFSQHRPGATAYSLFEIRNALRTTVSQLPVELRDGEDERVRTIIAQAPVDAPERATMLAQIERISQAQKLAGAPLTGMQQVPTAMGATAVDRAQAWNHILPGTDDIFARSIHRLNNGQDVSEAVWGSIVNTGSAAAILPILRSLSNSEDQALLEETIANWCVTAPKPSFGFWKLAGYLQNQKLQRAGACVAKRAVEEDELADEADQAAITTKAVNWALRKGSDSELRFWLEAAQPNGEGKSADA